MSEPLLAFGLSEKGRLITYFNPPDEWTQESINHFTNLLCMVVSEKTLKPIVDGLIEDSKEMEFLDHKDELIRILNGVCPTPIKDSYDNYPAVSPYFFTAFHKLG